MSLTYGPIVPEGQHPPFAVVTPDDHSAWIIITAVLGLICSLFFGTIRILVRLTINPKFKLDDYSLFGATFLTIIQSSIILGACHKDVLYKQPITLALGLSKISVVCFLLRLSPTIKRHQLVFKTAIGVIVLWTAGAFLVVALQCDLQHPWISVGQKCSRTLLRWQVVCAFDMILEVSIVALAVYLVWSLQSSWSSKVMVVSIFSFRLLLIIRIAFRIKTFDETGWTTNPFLTESSFIAWTQSELNYSLISATIPTFQNFLKNMNTKFGGIGNHETTYGYGSGTGSRARKHGLSSFKMSNLGSVNATTTVDEEREENPTKPPTDNNLATRTSSGTLAERSGSEGQNGETLSISSNESRRLMIRKDVTWNIITENRG